MLNLTAMYMTCVDLHVKPYSNVLGVCMLIGRIGMRRNQTHSDVISWSPDVLRIFFKSKELFSSCYLNFLDIAFLWNLECQEKGKGSQHTVQKRTPFVSPGFWKLERPFCVVPSWGLEPSIDHSLHVTAFQGGRPWREQLFLLRPMGLKPVWAIVWPMPSSWKNEGEVWMTHTALSLCGISVDSRRYSRASSWVILIEFLERFARNTDIHQAFTRVGKHAISFIIHFRILDLWGYNFKKLTVSVIIVVLHSCLENLYIWDFLGETDNRSLLQGEAQQHRCKRC